MKNLTADEVGHYGGDDIILEANYVPEDIGTVEDLTVTLFGVELDADSAKLIAESLKEFVYETKEGKGILKENAISIKPEPLPISDLPPNVSKELHRLHVLLEDCSGLPVETIQGDIIGAINTNDELRLWTMGKINNIHAMFFGAQK